MLFNTDVSAYRAKYPAKHEFLPSFKIFGPGRIALRSDSFCRSPRTTGYSTTHQGRYSGRVAALGTAYNFLGGGESDALGVRDNRLMLGLSYSSMDMARDMRRSTPGGGREVRRPCPWQKSSSDCATFAGWKVKKVGISFLHK